MGTEMKEGLEKWKNPAAVERFAGWILGRLRHAQRADDRLKLIQRIQVAPKQGLALVEVEGRRLLLATGSDGAPAFFPLEHPPLAGPVRASRMSRGRISW